MNKKQLVDDLSEKRNISKKESMEIFDDIISLIKKSLKDNDKFEIPSFGKFEIRDVEARKGRNPRTGEEIDIPAKKVIKFVVSKSLKDEFNN